MRDGRLAAVIDVGTCGVGDPARDLTVAWTLLPAAGADAFRTALGADARAVLARVLAGALTCPLPAIMHSRYATRRPTRAGSA